MKRCPNCGKQYPDDANFCPTDAGRLEADPGETQRGHAPAGADIGTDAGAGGAAAAEPDNLLGGRFEMGERIGGSATGEVYRAVDRQGGECAVKLVHAAVFPNPLLLQRAERELKHLERVELPEVARLLGHGRRGEQLWLAMERIDGAPLSRAVSEGGPMPGERACAVVRAVAHGLAEAAKQGVIHRDVAAKNVLLCGGDAVKIINFPIALPFSEKVQGVAEFLSPEQVEGRPADQRSSIYSLGALLYFCVTGRPPFAGSPEEVHGAHLGQEPVPPSQLVQVAPAVEAVIHRAMEKTSAKRYLTLHQLIDALDAVVSGAAAVPQSMAAIQGMAGAQGKSKAALPAHTLLGVPPLTRGPDVGAGVNPARAGQGETMSSMRSGEIGGSGAGDAAGGSAPAAAPAQPAAPAAPAQPAAPAAPAAAPQAAPAQPATPAVTVSAPPQPQVPARPQAAAKPAPVAAPAGGKGKPRAGGARPESKGKFRETMWFKKGELDAAAAQAAATAKPEESVADKADALPIEDRYKDDGTLSNQDAQRLSLRTGATQMMQAMRAPAAAPRAQVSEAELVGEMRSGRTLVIVLVLLGLACIGGLIAFFLSH